MGNKWRKLKYNLQECRRLGINKILSFGGAYSNHIHALAAAGYEFGFETLGIIRGEELTAQSNQTLLDAQNWGMKFEFVSRSDYRHKENFENQYRSTHYLIPEGGANDWAIKGLKELGIEICSQIHPDYILTALGTGTTLAGLCQAVPYSVQVIGLPTVKGFKLEKNMYLQSLLKDKSNYAFWQDELLLNYGEVSDTLIDFMQNFENEYGFQLDQIYTARLFYNFYKKVAENYFPENSTIVLVHTGGLQGNKK